MSWLILFLRTRQEKEGEQLVYPLTSACSSTQRSLPYRGNISARVGKEKQRQRGIKKKNKKKIQKGEKKEQRRQRRWQHSDDDTNRRSDNEDGAPGAAWKVAEAASSCFFVLFFYVGFRSGKPTWHLQLSLRGPWLLRLIRLPERTIGVRCRTLVWIQPSFSNWIRSLSGSHGLVLVRGRRDTEGEMIGHAEGKCGKTDRGRMKK